MVTIEFHFFSFFMGVFIGIELTGFLFTFALGFKTDLDEPHKKELWNSILKMLNTDVKKVGK